MAKKKRKIVQKPFEKGAAADSRMLRRALTVAGYVLISCVLYMMLGMVFVFENFLLRALFNLALVFTAAALIYVSGANAGVDDVTFGEIIYRRKEVAGAISNKDIARCYHPLKGFIGGLIGVFPFLIVCLILAFTTHLQEFTLGTLPEWTQSFTRRPDLGAPLLYYQREVALGLTDYLRFAVRILHMPYMNIVGSTNTLGVLWVERLSPLLCLIPAAAYGFGYRQGPKARAQVHTNIAKAKRKQKRLEAKQTAERKSNEPERLI